MGVTGEVDGCGYGGRGRLTSECMESGRPGRASATIAELAPELDDLFRKENVGLSTVVDPGDPHVVNIRYPAVFSEAYISPEVRLEVGPLGSWVPSTIQAIRPYTFGALPDIFENPDCKVLTIAPERTFWEKATILHNETHRKTQIPQRFSRHYYDLYKLAISPIRIAAFDRDAALRARDRANAFPSDSGIRRRERLP